MINQLPSKPPRAMVLAAGRGQRMRPLTDRIPKPLLDLAGQPLIAWSLHRLGQAGVREVVINVAYRANQIIDTLGDGSAYGLSISYSRETEALETAGGIALAREHLGPDPFLLVNGDIYCEFDLSTLVAPTPPLAESDLGICVVVPNPSHVPNGDFALENGRLRRHGQERLTYAGVALLRPELVADIEPGTPAALGPLLHDAAAADQLAAVRFDGCWHDVGTPQRLRELNDLLRRRRL